MKLADYTPEQIRDLFIKHKIRPIAGQSTIMPVNGQECACALGAISAEIGRPMRRYSEWHRKGTVATLLGVFDDCIQAGSFGYGFDAGLEGRELTVVPALDRQAIRMAGYEAGKFIRENPITFT